MSTGTNEPPSGLPLADLGDDDLGVLLSLSTLASPEAGTANLTSLSLEFKRRFTDLIVHQARAAGSNPKGDSGKENTVSMVLNGLLPSPEQPGLIRSFDPRRTPFGQALASWTRQLIQKRVREALTATLKDGDGPKPLLGSTDSPIQAAHPEAPIPSLWPESKSATPWSSLPETIKGARSALESASNALDEPSHHPGLAPEVASFSLFSRAATLWRFGGHLATFQDRLNDPLARGWALAFLDLLEFGSHLDGAIAAGPDALVDLLIRRDQLQGAVCLLASLLVQLNDHRGECRQLTRIVADLAAWDQRLRSPKSPALDEALSSLQPLAARFDASRLHHSLDWWWFGPLEAAQP